MAQQHFIDLKDLAQAKVSVRGSFEPGIIDFTADAMRQVRPLEWSATAERAGAEIRIVGTLDTVLETACSRCLEPAQYELSRPFDLYFRQRDDAMFDEDDEVELSEKETRTAFFSGTQLAISDILHEQVLLALPMRALCELNCKGLCPACGTNWNQKDCKCPKETFSPHMDALLEIKRKLEDRSL